MKILIIEDNPEIQEAVSLIFELHWPGASVVSTAEGGQGISMIETESPDIIILDRWL
jgi:two-component system KDP operon response regulator KdpE